MTTFTVELSFAYRTRYTVTMPDDNPQGAIDAAQAHDALRHVGTRVPADVADLAVTMDRDRQYYDHLDARVWNDQGEEIERD